MPRICCSPGCKSNYKTGNYVATFSFPSNKELREKWIKCVPRKDWTCTKSSTLCVRHFRPEDVVDSVTYMDEDGSLKSIKTGKITLKPGALPLVWPGLPAHLAEVMPEIERQVTGQTDKQHAATAAQKRDVIKDYHDFLNNYSLRLEGISALGWCVTSNCRCTVFCVLNIDDIPSVQVSIKVTSELNFEVHVDPKQASLKHLELTNPKGKLKQWSELEELISHYSSSDYCPPRKSGRVSYTVL